MTLIANKKINFFFILSITNIIFLFDISKYFNKKNHQIKFSDFYI